MPTEITDDMACVDAIISEALHSDVSLIREVVSHIVSSGGKRIRPILVLLVARACGCKDMSAARRLAAVVEVIHTTTLLHDDVVDGSEMRRGCETANVRFGNAASVLVGDFLYSCAFRMIVEIGRMSIMEVLSEATNIIAEGEVLQLINMGNPALSEAEYLEIVQHKTAKLFEVSARFGAMAADASSEIEASFADYGRYLGTAFQVIDDLLDFFGDADAIGKNLGDDLAEGKTTLPVIYAMAKGSPEAVEAIRGALSDGGRDRLGSVLAIIKSTGAVDMTHRYARNLADLAIERIAALSDSQYKKTLVQLPRFVVERAF